MFEWISAVEEQPQQPKTRSYYVGDGLSANVRLGYDLVPKEIRVTHTYAPMIFDVDPKVYEAFRDKCRRDGLDEDQVIEAFLDYYLKNVFK